MTRKQRRLVTIGLAGSVLAIAATLILTAAKDKIVFFYGPTELKALAVSPGQRLRIGGLIEAGSLVKSDDLRVSFRVTDGVTVLAVAYRGLLPDLFREGQGVVAEGVLESDGTFRADSVLAKHDENYMPKEVAEALRKQGVWKGQKDGASP
ncbi:MAG: cytochrome c maturation protein CcmE [Hyphomicrobiales bacterium]